MKYGLVLFLVILAGNIFAQRRGNERQPTPEQRTERLTSDMRDSLDLTTDQTERVRSINAEFVEESTQLLRDARSRGRSSAGDARRILRVQMNALDKKRMKQLKKVLDDHQYAHYETMKAAREEQRRERMQRQGRRRGGRG